jgi:hypothetical protein
MRGFFECSLAAAGSAFESGLTVEMAFPVRYGTSKQADTKKPAPKSLRGFGRLYASYLN